MWDDINAALDIGEFDGVVAAKLAGVLWPGRLDAWVSLHPERFAGDIEKRRRLGHPPALRLFAHETASEQAGVSRTSYRWPGQKRSASSGMFAAKVALEDLGFDRAVLCGVPLDKEAGRLDKLVFWPGASSFRQGFNEALPRINHRLCSMSGWTMLRLGRPTASWLKGGGIPDPGPESDGSQLVTGMEE